VRVRPVGGLTMTATLTVTIELPEGVEIEVGDYRYHHGRPPSNDHGVWGFQPLHDDEGEHIELAGELLDVIDRLPPGRWQLMP
jgi:hypothetical protein